MTFFQRAVVVCAFLAGMYAWPSCMQAQSLAPSGALAFTSCLGGHVTTFVNAEMFGTDSLQEILVHEAKHREQAARFAPGCPVDYKPWELLRDEVEAYCASKPLRMQRGWLEIEVDVNYLTRLFNQFKGAMPRHDIIRAWREGCPTAGVFRLAP